MSVHSSQTSRFSVSISYDGINVKSKNPFSSKLQFYDKKRFHLSSERQNESSVNYYDEESFNSN